MDNHGKQRALEFIDPTKIRPNEDKINNSVFRNARTTLKKEEMATNRESIRKLGLLKPLIVRPITNDPDGYLYQLVCGSRRLRNILRLRQEAIGVLNENRPFRPEELCYCPETAEWLPATEVYATVKAFVRECDDETAIAINIAENLEHSKLPEIDLMEFCQELTDLKNHDGTPKYSRTKIADMCNRHESWVSLTLELIQLPDAIRQMMYNDQLTRTAALAFLQTKREKIDEVIEVGKGIVRQEKLAEAKVAEEEIRIAQIDLEDAQNDAVIHDMMQNTALLQMAKKREGVARKRVSSASEKRDTALKEAQSPKLTGDVINKANLIVPEAKKGKPKAMPTKEIRKLYAKFTEFRSKQTSCNGEVIVYDTINVLLETILGHRAFTSIEDLLIKPDKDKEVSIIIENEDEEDFENEE
jgi:ParB-like chromosome segregation protein Spo0J